MSVTERAQNFLLTIEQYEKLQRFIHGRLGLYFPENKKYLLEHGLQSRLTALNLQTFDEYYLYLQYDPDREKEIGELTDTITTNETYFFRDDRQIACLRTYILPALIAQQESRKTLRIWSAGCSSGEEPYTLSMILCEDFPHLSAWDVQIFATDINGQVLEKARTGHYGEYAVRNIPGQLLKKYFTVTDGHYEIQKRARQWVTFSALNLVDVDQMRSMRDVDLIVCRNVLIYFDEQSRQQIVSQFYEAFRDHGVLMIGFSEKLEQNSQLFSPVCWDRTIVYRKQVNWKSKRKAVHDGFSN